MDVPANTAIKGRYTYLPRELYKLLDIVFYQSGHNSKDRTKPYSQAEEMLEKYAGKPLINSEPCYEEMGYSGKTYGRWSRRDVRRAAYVSVLSGASAGITYGAAGIYSWHRINKNYAAVLGEGFDAPKSWNEALLFPGAWDYGFLKRIFEQLNINDLVPRQDLLMNLTDEIRVAQNSNNLILAYVPYNTKVRLDVDLSGWKVQAISLTDHNIADLDYEIINEKMVISMHPFSEDALYILKK